MQQYAFAVAALALVAAGEVQAQQPHLEGERTESGRPWALAQLAGGYAHAGGDLPGAFGLGVFVGARPRDRLGFEVGLTRAVHDGTTLNFGYVEGESATLTALQAALTLYTDAPQEPVQPYFLAGVGHTWADNGSKGLFAPLGVGLRGALGRFFLDGRFTYDLPVMERGDKEHRFQVQLGAGFRL